MMLSTYKTSEIISAILNRDIGLIKSIKGIGPKSAERIILELRDKLDSLPQFEDEIGVKDITLRDEALTALVSLGFNKTNCVKIINKILSSESAVNTVEDLIKRSLKQL
jgi:holliday junction DNA helicase RuvA